MTTNEERMAIMPESMYTRQNLKAKDIKEGDIIPVIVTGYDHAGKRICCEISSHLRKAFIRVENFMFPELPCDFDSEHIPATISSHIGKQIVAKVVTKGCNGNIELDRRVVMRDTINYFSDNLGTVVVATMGTIRPHKVFVDIGNGVETILRISQFSVAWYARLDALFKVGEQVEVRLIDFDPDANQFSVSRKHAYEREILPCGSIQRVRILTPENGDYMLAEFNPNTIGFIDYVPKFKKEMYGKYATCLVTKNTSKGFKSNFISWD